MEVVSVREDVELAEAFAPLLRAVCVEDGSVKRRCEMDETSGEEGLSAFDG